MERDILVVIDMQNDFITGSLANKEAEKILPNVAKLIKEFDGDVIFTRDMHDSYIYPRSMEGKYLPIEHCIKGTYGHQIHRDLLGWRDAEVVDKANFGSMLLLDKIGKMISGYEKGSKIHFCGTVTEICVISNVLLAKTRFPETKIIVHKECCAGLNEESHNAALTVMKSCQCEVAD